MLVSQLLTCLFLCSVTTAKAEELQDATVKLDPIQRRQSQAPNGLDCILIDIVVALQDLLGDPGATSYCQRCE